MAKGGKIWDAFENGEHFRVRVLAGQQAVAAVRQALARKKHAESMTLWPVGNTPHGEKFRATWYEPKREVFGESEIEIWHAYRTKRPVHRGSR
jgi:hypothetical protein